MSALTDPAHPWPNVILARGQWQVVDFVKNFGNNDSTTGDQTTAQQTTGGAGGGLMGKLNEMGGGGQKGEANEDYLDKAVDMAQQYMGKGDQSNESALEQGTDEAISDSIRSQYKNVTGTDFPIADK